MAIVKMKKLRLLAVRDSKEELLKELIRFGCVEFSELDDELRVLFRVSMNALKLL